MVLRPRSAGRAVAAAAAALALTAGLVTGGPAAADPSTTAAAPDLPTSDTGRWVVRLADPSLAAHQVATADAGQPDLTSPGARAYLAELARYQERVTADIGEHLGRPVEVPRAFRNVLNAIVIEAEPAEAAGLTALPDVVAVEPDRELTLTTDASHDLIGSAAVWDGDTGPDLPTRGEGVVVGVLDTGINPDHPSFAATDGEGFTHTNPYDGFLGVCDPAHPEHEPICNDKLVGAWNFTSAGSAVDANGHGSHTASTAAGNVHEATLTHGADEITRTVQGVAPRANLISYRVCISGCPIVAILAGIDQAVADGVDVINYSISGRDNPWSDSVDRAYLEAFGAGVFVSASAGNGGPGENSVAHTAPWQAAVAASTTDRIFANNLSVLGPDPVPPELDAVRAWPSFGPGLDADLQAELRYSGQVGSASGCSSFPAGAFAGAVALIPMGICILPTKVANAADAGAVAVVLFEREAGPPVFAADLEGTAVPSFSVDQPDGEALQQLATSAASPVTVQIGAETREVRDPAYADIISWFSSRGPSDFDVLAPTYAAPGVNVLAAWQAGADGPVQYNVIRGTSMAAPHGAGAAALLTALHPDWSPAQIRSALAGTADPSGVRGRDGVGPATPFDAGSGRIDLAAAGRVGLVLDETHDAMRDADPATGGDPRALNVPHLVNRACSLECGWTRVVQSAADAPATYTATVDAPSGVDVTVEPATFTIDPGAIQTLTVTADVRGASGGDWAFGDLRLSTDDSHAGGAAIADVHYPLAVIPVAPAIEVTPAELAVALKPDRQALRSLSIGNTGDGDLTWELATGPDGCDAPADLPWLSVAGDAGGVVPPDDSTRLPLSFDTTGLAPGTLTATLCVASDDPGRPLVTVPVVLTVRDEPTMVVTPEELAVAQPVGTVTGTPLTIANTGTDPLHWEIAEAAAAAPADLSDLDPARRQLLQDGVLVVPDTTNDRAVALDPDTGEVVDEDFLVFPEEQAGLGVSTHVILNAAQDGFLVSSQSQDVVHAFDLAGEYQGVFAPAGGVDTSIMNNIRGMAISPWGTLLVTSSSGQKVVEFDADGEFVRDFIPDFGTGPWFLLFGEDDLLVTGGLGSSSRIRRYDHDGNLLETFPDGVRFPQQIHRQNDGNLLVAGFSPPAGVWELTPDGELINRYTGTSSNRGAYALPNGNILTTGNSANGRGVHEVDRAGTVVDTKYLASGARMITEVRLDPCLSPEDVPWLSVSERTGTTPGGGSSELTVRVDSTGLAPGVHQAHLCVTGDDPDLPLQPVPVTVTVADQACDRTIHGVHRGPVLAAGLTCLASGADVSGPVTVLPGGSLFASDAAVSGPVSAAGAAGVEVQQSTVSGAVSLVGGTGRVVVAGNRVTGPVSLVGNQTGDVPIVVAGNTIAGVLACFGNQPPPVNNGAPNTVDGLAAGQCRDL